MNHTSAASSKLTALSCKQLSFSYDQKLVLKELDLEVKQGEYLVILGHNGSGKSTLARHFNALLQAEQGEIYAFGLDASDYRLHKKIRSLVGMVFQNPDDQMVSSVVKDDIAFGPENLGVESEEIARRVEEVLKKVGMQKWAEADPSELSGGQKQRIAIAGILAMKPKLIVFDESGSMLDPRGRKSLQKVMKELNDSGFTIIHITHFMDDALEAKRVIVMNQGRIVLDGNPHFVFAHDNYLKSLGLELPFEQSFSQKLRDHGIDLCVDSVCSVTDEGIFARLLSYLQTKEISQLHIKDRAQMDENRPEIIRAEHLSFSYQGAQGLKTGNHTLEDISFSIQQGSFVGLLGHTGSGKSSLMEHFNALKSLQQGELLIEGVSCKDKPGKKHARRVVGYVSQYPEHQLFAETIYEDIAFGPKNLGVDVQEIDQRVRESMEALGLDFDELKDLSPFELSGGQQRRIAIAGILAMKPKILLLDEPLAGLDPIGRQDILSTLKRLHQEGCTIIMVSHSMDEIAELADHILILEQGKLVLNGSTAEVFSQAERLAQIGLDVPTSTKLYTQLQEAGIQFNRLAYTEQQLIDAVVAASIGGITDGI